MKQHIRIFLVGAIALSLSACGQQPANSSMAVKAPEAPITNSMVTPPAVQPNQEVEAKPSEQGVSHQIKAYYGDEQASKLVEQNVSINYKEEKDKYTTALWTLKKAPADSKLVPLGESLGFKSAVVKDKKLTLDITVSGEGRLGGPGEALLLQAIQKTLFQFPEVDSIDILVDGKPAETLMGHMELEHPIKR
ncbi:GerMN domain-containing protein [Paenibacillus agricola]|uniref:GerMN domain-containing protein n=1 Tax=Paenibacillus agricola TaxID=2716264 RepID=A0ABX0JAH0_9BACL|nr:GerMN domain-containing protein [Paenibacillus agricola]NHN31872.1 GerMN domain-containing protein [Paenibacillus agricola]